MRRGSHAVLIAMIVAAAACGKENDKSRAEKLSPPLAAPAPAPTDVLTGLPAALPRARLPAWARESPHFFNRGGRRFASAVGSARIDNPALARTAATDRARAELLRLIQGGNGEGELTGARVTNAFTSKTRGEVFVRVEIEETPEL